MANTLAYYALAEVLESIRNQGQKPHLNGLALPLNNRLGCFLKMANTLAYFAKLV